MSDRIERELTVPANLATVWEAVTGDGWLADQVFFDLRPGGDAVFSDADAERRGWVEDVRAPGQNGSSEAHLAFWWAIDDEPASRVELTLEPQTAELTRIIVVETRPLDRIDLIGTPMRGLGGRSYGPALVAA